MITPAYILLTIGVLLILAGCWCLIRTYHLLKMTIGIEVAMKGVTFALILAGNISSNVKLSEAYVITVILLEVVVAVVGIGMSASLFRKYGSMDVRNLSRLKG